MVYDGDVGKSGEGYVCMGGVKYWILCCICECCMRGYVTDAGLTVECCECMVSVWCMCE